MKHETHRRYEVVLAGSGGQGLAFSGIMLGEAAILEGRNVTQTSSYGIFQRGGLSIAEVIISDEEILYQRVQNPDIVLALNDSSMKLYAPLADKGVVVFYDSTLAQGHGGENLYGYPFTEMASELGHLGTANVMALGVLIEKSGMIKLESLAKVLRKHFKGKTLEMNISALHMGAALRTA
jgi:2-oxoglutarate ferredoxin oxidoreductase subunit gamma